MQQMCLFKMSLYRIKIFFVADMAMGGGGGGSREGWGRGVLRKPKNRGDANLIHSLKMTT